MDKESDNLQFVIDRLEAILTGRGGQPFTVPHLQSMLRDLLEEVRQRHGEHPEHKKAKKEDK